MNVWLNDIRLLDGLDEGILKEDVKIENRLYRKLLLNKSKKFQEDNDEFKTWLQLIHMECYMDIFSNNGILTLESFHHYIKNVEDLGKIIGELNAEFIWNSVPQLVE